MAVEYLQRRKFHNLSGQMHSKVSFPDKCNSSSHCEALRPQENLIIKEWNRKQNQNILSICLLLELELLSALDADYTAKYKSNIRFWELGLGLGAWVFLAAKSIVFFCFLLFSKLCALSSAISFNG